MLTQTSVTLTTGHFQRYRLRPESSLRRITGATETRRNSEPTAAHVPNPPGEVGRRAINALAVS